MPRVVRVYLKTALVYFAAALALNLLIALRVAVPAGRLQPVSVHLLTVGWLSQLIVGVALWMFPKYSQAQPRGPEWVNWLIYILLNAGLLLRAAAEPAVSGTGSLWDALIVLSALLQWLAGALFVITLWRRVKVK